MALSKKQAVQLALIMAFMMSGYFIWQDGLKSGLIQGVLSAILSAILVYFLNNSNFLKNRLSIQIPNQENAIYIGAANHFKNGEGVGGKLALFRNELFFKSHRFNIQNHELHLPLSTITEVNPYKIAGAFNTGLAVKTSNGNTEKFVVCNREDWQAAILAAKGVNS